MQSVCPARACEDGWHEGTVSVPIEPAGYLAGPWSVREPARAPEVGCRDEPDSDQSDLAFSHVAQWHAAAMRLG